MITKKNITKQSAIDSIKKLQTADTPVFKVDLGDLPRSIEGIADKYFGGQKDMQMKDLETEDRMDARAVEFETFKLSGEQKRYFITLAVVSVFVVFIMGIASGLIFLLDKFEYGVLLITHVIALGAGYLGGSGIAGKEPERPPVDNK